MGDFRTWVQYQEQGTFPAVKRHFAVLRCNHCDNAPCVRICPVNALEKRADGIVDVDRDACIGCRACMQACPYDAIYLNDDTGSIEKCHYCAHRVENGIEPACVVVCPEKAIIAGDLNDPRAKIARMIAENDTLVRRPEQNTGPNVHYKGVEPTMLEPGSATRPDMYIWSDRPPEKPEAWPISLPVIEDARTVLDVGHRVEWNWPVAMYLVTKSIAAGAAILAPFAGVLGLRGAVQNFAPEIIALVFTLITLGLLVEDLSRPSKFFRLLTRPNWRSWLVRGGVILGGFVAIESVALILRFVQMDALADMARWVGLPMGVMAAGYTAFLFKQCEGRDLWQSEGLFSHLLIQAVLCGALVFLPFSEHRSTLEWFVIIPAILHFMFALHNHLGEHETSNALQAAAFLGTIRLGPMRALRGSVLMGVTLVLILVFFVPIGAMVAGLAGLYAYEWAFVRAGQLPPLS